MTILSTQWDFPEGYVPYKNRTEEEKQMYWNGIFFYRARSNDNNFPIDLADFKEEKNWIEPNLNRFLPGILASCYLFCDTIEDIFILDESAKEYLASLGLTDIEACFAFEKNKSEYITIDTRESVENIIKNEEKSWWENMKQILRKLVNHFWKEK